jgi:hypothetical protein
MTGMKNKPTNLKESTMHKAHAKINPKHEARNPKQIQNSKAQNSKQKQFAARGSCFRFGHLNFSHWDLFRISDFGFRIFLSSFIIPLYPSIFVRVRPCLSVAKQ